MDSAVTALQLVLCEDEERAAELAHKLNEINAARQETEGEIAKAAQAQLEAEPAILEDRVILIWGRDWHPGVIGIVALPPVRIFSSASAATPWRRAFRCGRRTCRSCAAA